VLIKSISSSVPKANLTRKSASRKILYRVLVLIASEISTAIGSRILFGLKFIQSKDQIR